MSRIITVSSGSNGKDYKVFFEAIPFIPVLYFILDTYRAFVYHTGHDLGHRTETSGICPGATQNKLE